MLVLFSCGFGFGFLLEGGSWGNQNRVNTKLRLMLKRKAAEGGVETTTASKHRKVIDELADELVCVITQELPVDPVTAEDGRIYERTALEEWFAAQEARGHPIKSPVTNEAMGKRLFPAVQIRNNIKSMVKSGAISGAKADAWKRRMEDEMKVEAK